MTAPGDRFRSRPRNALLLACLTLLPGVEPGLAAPPPAHAPTPRSPSEHGRWSKQRVVWERLARDLTPLARRGAPLPTPKLEQAFRRQRLWHHPSFDLGSASAPERALLSPTGPASRRDALGPAGRAVWVEGATPVAGTAPPMSTAVRQTCRQAERRCGLSCTFAPPLPPAPAATPSRAIVRTLRRLQTDHALVLTLDGPGGQVGLYAPSPHPTDLAAHADRSPGPTVPTVESLRPAILAAAAPLRAPLQVPQPLFRLTLGLQLPAPDALPAPVSARQLAETLCRLADQLPDQVHRAWTGTKAVREARALALGRWLGLRFEERRVAEGRPPLEQRYVRIHYRDRVFNFQQRARDKAVLTRPLMVVIHDTGGMSLSSALHTLRAKQIGQSQGPGHRPGSLSVGVPYLVGRDGTIFRLLEDDSRFARHTIGLNHSALGIENVGNRHHPLTPQQIEANARLVEYASLRFPLRWLLGHREVYQMALTGYYLEAIPGYCSDKNDPPWETLRALRRRLAHLEIEAPPSDPPKLRSCADLLRYFRSQRRRSNTGAPPPARAPR